MLIDAIKTHALANAQSGDWPAVAATLQAVSVTAPARVCWAVESGAAAVAAGGDHTELLTVLLGDVNGTMLFQRLSSGIGVEWAHPVTVPYLQSLVSAGKMTQQVMDALVQLSAPITHPHASVTAGQCETAWNTDQLSQLWTTALNDGGINQALAIGDRATLKSALTTLSESL
jgi:hypothetical protein